MRPHDIILAAIAVFLFSGVVNCAIMNDDRNRLRENTHESRRSSFNIHDIHDFIDYLEDIEKVTHYHNEMQEKFTTWCLEDHHGLHKPIRGKKNLKKKRNPVLEAAYNKLMKSKLSHGRRLADNDCIFK
ncbi:hypothetical protein Plhal304r1_c001g0003671 [Plasmopara halstedii]